MLDYVKKHKTVGEEIKEVFKKVNETHKAAKAYNKVYEQPETFF